VTISAIEVRKVAVRVGRGDIVGGDAGGEEDGCEKGAANCVEPADGADGECEGPDQRA
jgi:hypothetical protein